MATIFHNGRFFTTPKGRDPEQNPVFVRAMLVENGIITHVGGEGDSKVVEARTQNASTVDLQNRIVLPGLIDGHMHLLMHGMSLSQCDVAECGSLENIRTKIKAYAQAHPDLPRVLCGGWQQYTTQGLALASMLDGIDPRPIFITALDMHSTWCNEAALQALALDNVADPVGGKIHRDAAGAPSGLLSEAATLSIFWPYLARVTSVEAKLEAIEAAVASYSAQGYTGIVDMAMDEDAWEALQLLRSRKELPVRIAAHWLIEPTIDRDRCLAQVDRAIALNRLFNADLSPQCRIAGIKLICDGVVDSCTAALRSPYSDSTLSGDLLWTADMARLVLRRADAAGLQCALHAIGDRAIKLAVDALEEVGSVGRRHRIEHLELASAEDAQRLGKLGITASVQPVHSDPAITRAWPQLVGQHRCDRAFPYKEFADNGAPLAFGSDSPTATHVVFHNLYSATTRRSATEPQYKGILGKSDILPLVTAVCAATSGAAYSCFAEKNVGQLAVGYKADFVVVNMDWDHHTLLKSRVQQTWFEGRKVYDCSL